MSVISTADFSNGMVVLLDNDLMEIVDFQHVKPGKGGAFVRTKFKNVLTGRVLERTFRSGERMTEVQLEMAVWQYLYHDDHLYYFMNEETYEQIEVNADLVGDQSKWLKENGKATLLFHDGKVIRVTAPTFVVLTITQSDPGMQGDRASGATKPATLETGAVVLVPLFVNEGESIRVDTRTGDYIERANNE